MMNHFETYFDAYSAYFTVEPHQLKITPGQFEIVVFVIISTRGNKRRIARAPLALISLHVTFLDNNKLSGSMQYL